MNITMWIHLEKVYFEVVHSLPEADFDHKKERYNCSTFKTQKKHE